MILKDKNAGIFTMKCNIGEYFGTQPKDFWIVLREPTMDEVLKIQSGKDEAERITSTFNKMADMIVDHNFEKENNQNPAEPIKLTNKEVWSAVMERSDAASVISEQWTENCPLFKRSKTKSGE